METCNIALAENAVNCKGKTHAVASHYKYFNVGR